MEHESCIGGIRRQYQVITTRFGPEGANAGMEGFPGGFGVNDIFSDLMDGIFGQGTARRGTDTVIRGDDLREDIRLTLEEVVTGTEKTIKFPRMESCEVCQGSGARHDLGDERTPRKAICPV